MKTTIEKIKVLFGTSLLLTLLTTVLRTISLLTVFDSNPGYYQKGAFLPYLQKALLLASVVYLLIELFLLKKETLPAALPTASTPMGIASLLCGFAYVCAVVLLYLNNHVKPTLLFFMILLTGLLSTGYFLYDALCPSAKKIPTTPLFGLAVVVNLLLLVIKEYLDYSVALNVPHKILVFFSFIVFALYFIQELRFAAGNAQPKFRFISGCIAFLLCTVSAIPGMIAHYAGVLHGVNFLIYDLMNLTFASYILIRLGISIKYARSLAAVSDEVGQATASEAPAATKSAKEDGDGDGAEESESASASASASASEENDDAAKSTRDKEPDETAEAADSGESTPC